MKAKAMCIKRICIAFFDAADDSAANSYYPKKLFQAVRGNNGNADEGNIINLRLDITHLYYPAKNSFQKGRLKRREIFTELLLYTLTT